MHSKTPFGVNPDRAKWTETLKDTSSRQQASPSAGTWYNLGALSLAIPIGIWRVLYELILSNNRTAGTVDSYSTLSTANNSESDNDFTALVFASSVTNALAPVFREKHLSLAVKTTYYLNAKTTQSGLSSLTFQDDSAPGIVRAVFDG